MRRTARFLTPGFTRKIFHRCQTAVLMNAVGLFNARDAGHREALNALIDLEITQKGEKNMPLNATFEKMIAWLRRYLNNPTFIAQYSDRRSLELVAEATFWSVQLGLETHLAKMSYAEIREFQPLDERFQDNITRRSALIDEVYKKMLAPAMSHEASYALGQAAWCVYVRTNTLEKMRREERAYEAQQRTIQSTHQFRR